ncbi:MAG: glycine zipper family protein [Actinomycetota bacterium]|nr:glycine zipper family protein [Actinomycetota bacterium]
MVDHTGGHPPAAPRPSAHRVTASFERYSDAEKAVDQLSDRGFPVERAAIVASDLRFVEQVTGRLGYGRAALDGGSTGALMGALLGLVAGLFDWTVPMGAGLGPGLYGLVFGAVTGIVVGLAVHGLTHGRRDFASIGHVDAARYDVMVDEAWAEQAVALLEEVRGT